MTIRTLLLIAIALPLLLAACSEKKQTEALKETNLEQASPEQESPKQESTEQESSEQESSEQESQSAVLDKTNPAWKQNLKKPELMAFEEGKSYYWDMQTNKGDMSFRLYHKSAPMHVTSTIYLTKLGFYDGVIFHRVIPEFMAQGGDPTGSGRGGPGYLYEGEFDAAISHDKPGLLSMANAGPGTDGSQFFITFVPTPFLDGKHTLFGELLTGQETLKQLETYGSRSGTTSELLKINKATIRVE